MATREAETAKTFGNYVSVYNFVYEHYQNARAFAGAF